MPINSWLRNDLSPYLNDLINEKKINETGLFNSQYVNKLKSDFLENKNTNQTIIWKLLQFQQWYEMWM